MSAPMEVEGTASDADGGTEADLPPKAADRGGSSPETAAPAAAVAEAAAEQDDAGQAVAPEDDAGPAAVPADGAGTSPQAAAAAGPTEVAPERAAAPTPAAGATSPVPEQAQDEVKQTPLENTQKAQTGPTPPAPPETAKTNRYETKGARQCKNCGGWGHFAKTCPLRFGQQPRDDGEARTPAEAYAGPWTQPPDASQVFHARDASKGGKGGPTARQTPYSGSDKGRYEKLQEIGVVAGEWKPQEDAALMALVDLEGPGDWTTKSVTLGAACGFRSSTAIRKRYNRLAGIEGPAKSTGSGDFQGTKRKVPPEFDRAGASASVAGQPFPQGGICKGCIPRSKAKHTCGRQYSYATAARRYGADYASRGYGSDGKILQNPRSSSGREVSLMNQRNAQSQLPSCAACERQRKGCVHAVDIIPAPLAEILLPPNPQQASPNQGNIPKGECDFCRRRDGGETLRTGCGCRDSFYGFAGYAHVSCLMKAAEDDDQIFHDCPKCEQRWKGELAIELSRIKRSRSAEGPKAKRRPEDPECVRATVDLVATLCIAAVENQNLEYVQRFRCACRAKLVWDSPILTRMYGWLWRVSHRYYKAAASLGESTIDLLKGCFTLGPSRFSTRPQVTSQKLASARKQSLGWHRADCATTNCNTYGCASL